MPPDELHRCAVPALRRAADRLDELAETADLMGDIAGARRMRDEALANRLEAMRLLDD